MASRAAQGGPRSDPDSALQRLAGGDDLAAVVEAAMAQTWCGRFNSPQFGHSACASCGSASWLRRMPRRDGEVFLFGTAMGQRPFYAKAGRLAEGGTRRKGEGCWSTVGPPLVQRASFWPRAAETVTLGQNGRRPAPTCAAGDPRKVSKKIQPQIHTAQPLAATKSRYGGGGDLPKAHPCCDKARPRGDPFQFRERRGWVSPIRGFQSRTYGPRYPIKLLI